MSIVKYRPPNAPYHIAILGRSGVGKSSLCNLIRDLNSEHTDSSPVGVIETTVKPTCYKLIDNVFIWDVPGVATPSISKEDYCKLININRYDMFLILSRGRFTEIDLWLSDIVRDRFNKILFFIRTGIDEEQRNHRRDYPTNFKSTEVLNMIRNNCLKNLETSLSNTNLSLYLINTKDKTKYDCPKLINDIMMHVNHERDNLMLTLIKEDPTQEIIQSSLSSTNTTLQTAKTIAIQWARFGLVSYLYDRYYQ
ncbi:unnamed protein product [Rotaria sp. Silwood2]|nr:unnamed protein product [Rotaria sp. Silwood2]CAF2775180.1 unnamed protein product [Rotaria sp. Silwood2]CAF2995865.1 unnamed protein product [Rotaria sp. Silwood2]CAF3158641.1 unnamed protein product [Rotaria sp. Silwood2]CAF4102108.1 unnamed protein product [Rotaria sp. Silwood2]